MNYFNNISKYIQNKLWDLFYIKTGIVSDDRRNVQLITDNKCSHIINIYRFTSLNDVDLCVKQIGRELTSPIYN